MPDLADLLLIDAHTHVGTDLLFYLRGHFPYALDWPSLVEQGGEFGIRKFVVFPMVEVREISGPENRGIRDNETSD